MSHLKERISVACPLADAGMRLRDFFRAHGNASGDTAEFSLRASVTVPGLSMPLTLERSVIATIQSRHLPNDTAPRYRVQWAPQSHGPFPLFSGELAVESGDDYDSFALCLRGDYTPPFGIAGRGFDAVVGHRVAQETASNFLSGVRDFVEKKYALDVAGKLRSSEPSKVS